MIFVHYKIFVTDIYFYFFTFCKIWYFECFWWEFLNFSVLDSRAKKFVKNVKGNKIFPSSFSREFSGMQY